MYKLYSIIIKCIFFKNIKSQTTAAKVVMEFHQANLQTVEPNHVVAGVTGNLGLIVLTRVAKTSVNA